LSNVSRETLALLDAFTALVLKWNAKINLVSKSSTSTIHQRHIQDSLQLADLAVSPSGSWVDLGSGGGFPGIPLAIAFRENSDIRMTLVESDQRKCAFLRTVARELGLNIEVICSRIEDLELHPPEYISARALASLDKLLNYALPVMKQKKATCYFPKGQTWQQEVRKARESYSFSLEVFESLTQKEAAILKIEDLTRA